MRAQEFCGLICFGRSAFAVGHVSMTKSSWSCWRAQAQDLSGQRVAQVPVSWDAVRSILPLAAAQSNTWPGRHRVQSLGRRPHVLGLVDHRPTWGALSEWAHIPCPAPMQVAPQPLQACHGSAWCAFASMCCIMAQARMCCIMAQARSVSAERAVSQPSTAASAPAA